MDKEQAMMILMRDYMSGVDMKFSTELLIATHNKQESVVKSLWFSHCWNRYSKGDQTYYEILKCIQPDVIEGQIYPLVLKV